MFRRCAGRVDKQAAGHIKNDVMRHQGGSRIYATGSAPIVAVVLKMHLVSELNFLSRFGTHSPQRFTLVQYRLELASALVRDREVMNKLCPSILDISREAVRTHPDLPVLKVEAGFNPGKTRIRL